ncbi:MAG: aminopeptidase P family protein [Paludibacter sp.]|nr:aminopeptidase P family protein [Paludibacter sp.]
MNTIPQRLQILRNEMRKAGVAACIIPGTDPHASEYIADFWKEREWISGFDGSAGTAVVTTCEAGLWTDSRYFLQGSEQLKGTGFELMKMGLPETPDMLSWLAQVLKPGEKVAVNPQMFSLNAFASMEKELTMNGLQLVSADLMATAWTDRSPLPVDPFFVFSAEKAGRSCKEKIQLVRAEMQKAHADVFVMSALDDIAWLFNIRGRDVAYNPVVIAYALIDTKNTILYIDEVKLTPETSAYLAGEQVIVKPYLSIYEDLKNIGLQNKVLVDGAKLNQSLFEAIPKSCTKINQMSPVFKLKAIKNEVELAGIRKAMLKDGVALTRFFIWFENNINSGELSEVSIAEKLAQFRADQGDFFGESFCTIAGFAGHGAIVHYRADETSDSKLTPDNILLLDSGGQYLQGTTDITRTLTLGKTTSQQKTDNTLVLKGHIGIATAKFPVGTRGSQLDILARKAMWDLGINYGHGTGHGIGHFLNVHEGPQNIRMDENPTTLQPGMIISNEPGLYRANQYGIRIENLVRVRESVTTEFGQFLEFETLTLFPIDKNLIDKAMLSQQELDWFNAYHQEVYDKIAPLLSPEEQRWLSEKTSAL